MNAELATVLSMRQKEMSYHAACFSVTQARNLAHHVLPSRGGVIFDNQGERWTPLPYEKWMNSSLHIPGCDDIGYTWRWIVEISTRFALQRQTAHYARLYSVRILRNLPLEAVSRSTQYFRQLGLVCVFMAAKVEEIHPPKISELLECLGDQSFTMEDLNLMESDVLRELNWNLHTTTPYAWLTFLLVGEPIEDFFDRTSHPTATLLGKEDLFLRCIDLIDVALLEPQTGEFWPSALAGSALLLNDSSLDFYFVAHFLQLDPNVLWECKSWLQLVAHNLLVNSHTEMEGPYDDDRWQKVPEEELLFIQRRVSTSSASREGSRTAVRMSKCTSPSSSESYEQICSTFNGSLESTSFNVYHYKYGWHQIGGLASYPVYQHRMDCRSSLME